MSIISLLTDWQNRDYYLAALKGRLLSTCPNTQLIDLSHHVDNYNISQAAFILKNTYSHFPKGSIHLIGINSEESKEHPHVVVKYDGHYFIGANNGIFSLLVKNQADCIVRIENVEREERYITFPELDVFAKAAAHIIKHNDISALGRPINQLYKLIAIRATIQKDTITGHIIYIDSNGNVTTNISKGLFDSIQQGRDFEILVQSNHYRITKINRTYNESSEAELLAIFNSSGLLEIALNKGKLAQQLQLEINSNIRIKFNDN